MSSQDENRRAAWETAVKLKTFTRPQLADAVGRSYEWTKHTVKAWIAAGLIEEAGEQIKGYEVLRVLAKKKHGTAFSRERLTPEFAMWRTMRRMKTFTPEDVHLSANTEEQPISLMSVRRYCSDMTETGFLKCIRQHKAGSTPARYRIKPGTGPFPPRIRRVPAVYDPNAGTYQVLEKRAPK